jgi:hypothetical protein
LLWLFWRWGLASCSPELVSNWHPPNFSLPSPSERPVPNWSVQFDNCCHMQTLTSHPSR